MKLYAFQPDGHGPSSFFVMAQSTEDAKEAIDRFINEIKQDIDGRQHQLQLRSDWTTTEYMLTVCEQRDVITNDND